MPVDGERKVLMISPVWGKLFVLIAVSLVENVVRGVSTTLCVGSIKEQSFSGLTAN